MGGGGEFDDCGDGEGIGVGTEEEDDGELGGVLLGWFECDGLEVFSDGLFELVFGGIGPCGDETEFGPEPI